MRLDKVLAHRIGAAFPTKVGAGDLLRSLPTWAVLWVSGKRPGSRASARSRRSLHRQVMGEARGLLAGKTQQELLLQE